MAKVTFLELRSSSSAITYKKAEAGYNFEVILQAALGKLLDYKTVLVYRRRGRACRGLGHLKTAARHFDSQNQ